MKDGSSNRRRPFATALVVVLIAVGCAPALTRAADPNTLTDAERRDGWTLLFDGKSLALQDHGEEVAYRNLKVREIHQAKDGGAGAAVGR